MFVPLAGNDHFVQESMTSALGKMTLQGDFSVTGAEPLLSVSRDRALKSLNICGPDDVAGKPTIRVMDYLFITTRALISTINEIWKRCVLHRSQTYPGRLPFSRVSLSVPRTGQSHDRSSPMFIRAFVDSKDFGDFPEVPEVITRVFTVPLLAEECPEKECFSGMPDYSKFLDQVTLLRNEALLPFLIALKGHLEEVLVFLGEIEAFLNETHHQVQDLQEMFPAMAELDLPDLEDLIVPCGDAGGDRKCCAVEHPRNSLCQRCHRPFHAHHRGISRHGVITHLCDYHCRNVGSFVQSKEKLVELRIEPLTQPQRNPVQSTQNEVEQLKV